MPKKTPFHSRTSALCEGEAWVDWSGYLSANMYELDHSREYNAVRTSCGLFDVSPLYKYHLSGPGALPLLNRIVTRDISKCRVGQVMYTPWCDDDGKIIDDGTIARFDEHFYRLTAAIPSLSWLQDNAMGLDVEIEDVSQAYGGLALQGPTSLDVLQRLTSADLSGLGYFHCVEEKVAGLPARISRTGYTGDLGYEVFVENTHAEELWDALMETGQDYALRAAGNVALDMLRIEAGLILIDADFTSSKQTLFPVQRSSPYELGLGWTVKLKKDYFIGRDALRAEQAAGASRSAVGLEVDVQALERAHATFGMPLHLPYTSWSDQVPLYMDEAQEQHIGRATSGTWSPILKKYIVMGRVETDYSKPGSRMYIEIHIEGKRFSIPTTVVPMPFFDPPRKKQ